MKLLTHPDPALKARCEPVSTFDAELKHLVDQMLDVMYTGDGVGLAAPQVGVLKKIIIIDPSAGEKASDCTVMVNPFYAPSSARTEMKEEGCLSLPGVKVNVVRWTDIDVTFEDLSGKAQLLQLSGLAARIVQHEYDHLMGKTLLDHEARKR